MKKLIALLLTATLCMSFGGVLAEENETSAQFADFKLEKPANMNVGMLGNNGTAGDGKDVKATAADNAVTFEKIANTVTTQGNFYMHGQVIKNLTSKLLKDTTYIVEMYVKNAAPEVAETVQFGIMADYSHVGVKQIWDVSNTEYEKYTAILTPTVRDTSELSIGIPFTYTEIGAKVSVKYDTESLYVAPATSTEIKLERTDANAEAEEGTELAFKAEMLNQTGLPASDTSVIEWTVVTEDRTAEVTDGFVITPNGNEASVLINGAEPGKYAVVASSTVGENTLRTGVEFEVLKQKVQDSETKADGEHTYSITLNKTSGESSIGVFDKIALEAAVTDENGSKENYAQNFKWYVTDESRRNIVTDAGIVITPSEDTSKAVISLENNATNGNYYIVAESGDLRMAMPFTIDTSSTVADIAENINEKSAEEISEHIKDYAEILDINFAPSQNADADEWSKVVSESAKTVQVTSETAAELLKTAAIVSLYNKNAANEPLYDENGDFLYAKELGLENIDTNGVTIYSLFAGANPVISKDGKLSVQKSLTGKGFDTAENLRKVAAQEILLNSIAYTDNLGSGYMSDILTEENLKAVGITADDYKKLSDKTKIHTDMAGTLYTIKTLGEKLAAASSYATANKGSSGSSSGGGSGGGKFTPVVMPSVEKAEDKITDTMLKFTDVPSEHWAYSDIYHLTVRGIFSGKDEKHFSPDDVITREEIVKLICKAFNKTGTAKINFVDTDSNAWYAQYISAAIENNIINGISENEFGVGQPVTRQDMCVILARTLGTDISDEDADIAFADAGEVSEYAKTAVAYLSSLSAVNGFEDGTFRPQETCTRAQAAKILRCVIDIGGVLTDD